MSRRDSQSRPSARSISMLSLSVLAAGLLALPAAAYEAVQVSDGGSIKGKVLYQGEIATKKVIPTNDAETCGDMLEEPLIVVGSYNRVECATHGWMLGWVYAAEQPYYAVTKKDGTFSIQDVPPGSYTLVAWQEYTDTTEVPVTVKPKEATQQTIELKKK